MSNLIIGASKRRSHAKKWLKNSLLLSAGVSTLALAPSAFAQDTGEDEVIATGIRQSLENALLRERDSDSLVEVINGVATAGSGASRTGISFQDLNPAIIAAVEVIKASEANTVEGSVGGTINLQTLRPLDLKGTLANVRVQGEQSSLSTEGIQPRVSGALGHKWENASGQEIGFVLSASYTEQEAVSFRPRTDRDNIASPPGANPSEFLGIQFLVQEQENFDFETFNLAGTLEARPSDNVRLYFDAIVNEQQRSQDSYRLQASGVSSFRQSSIPSQFETIDFGVGPGQFPAALVGSIGRTSLASDNPNLRFSSDTGSRVTDTQVFTLGGEWEKDRLSARVEFSTSTADTENPNLSSTLNFLNPNAGLVSRVTFRNDDGSTSNRNVALVGVGSTSSQAQLDAALATAIASVPNGESGFIFNDNSTPFRYDLSNDSLAFGIDFGSDYAPTAEQLLDPNNVVLDQVIAGRNTTENKEDAFRIDLSYDLEGGRFGDFLSSIDVGYRHNESSSVFEDVEDRIGGFSRLADSPNGSLFADLLVAGPDNYGDSDGRDLFISNFLLVDPDLSFSDPQGVISRLESALIQHDSSPDLLNLRSDQNAFYNIIEKTDAFYAQANFDYGMIKGNAGFRYIETDIESIGFAPSVGGAARQLASTPGEYNFFLPRLNLAATPREDVVLRASYGRDIRRPDFDDLSTGFSFGQQENTAISLGNPGLEPEEVDSFDISADWYFAPAAVFSIGYFNKKRTNIFGQDFNGAALVPDVNNVNNTTDLIRENNPACPGGGIFNPEVRPNVLGDPESQGLCVDFTQPGNDPETTTQQGVEVTFQYSLSDWEDQMGGFAWASGFGVLANYTYQDFSGGSVIDTTSGRGRTVLGDVSIPRGLLDFSKNAYNLTAFYEKYGLSARARYTWREGFRTQDFGGGANTSGSSTFSFPVNTLDRGQLNASINYAVTDNFSVGVDGVNLTKSNIVQRCVSESGPTCFVGYPDRRIVFGGSYTF